MYYAIIGHDVENSLELRKTARAEHLNRLKSLKNEGRLLIAGPNPAIDSEEPGSAGYSGSVIIAEFDSLDDAKSWANIDPYVSAGVYQRVTVKPFKKALL